MANVDLDEVINDSIDDTQLTDIPDSPEPTDTTDTGVDTAADTVEATDVEPIDQAINDTLGEATNS